MANLGQQAGFYGGNEGEMGFHHSYQYTGTSFDSMPTLDDMPYGVSPHNPTSMGTQFNGQQYSQPAGSMHGIGFPDQTNISVQRTDTFDNQQHGQAAVTNYPISCSEQPNPDHTNINVRGKGKLKLTPEQQAANRKRADKEYRDRKKKEKIEMEGKLRELNDENKKLKKKIEELEGANASMIQNLQSKTEMIDKLKSDLDELKQQSEKESAIERKLLEIKDFKMFVNEGSKHYKEPIQNQFPSDEERQSGELLAAVKPAAVDGDDSGDENGHHKKKKKRAAPSAPSGRRSGKVPRVEDMDDELIETGQVTSAAKRQGSTSNPTAMIIDPYSITECLRILNTMGGIPYSIVKKAKAKFESRDEREYFVGLTDEDWRRGWVKDLEDS